MFLSHSQSNLIILFVCSLLTRELAFKIYTVGGASASLLYYFIVMSREVVWAQRGAVATVSQVLPFLFSIRMLILRTWPQRVSARTVEWAADTFSDASCKCSLDRSISLTGVGRL